jgi:RES domain-containing protein
MTTVAGGRPPLEVAELAAMPVSPAEVRAYVRHCYVPPAGSPDPLWVSASQPSRWRTVGGTLYLAEDAQTAWAESCRARAAQVAAADPTGSVGLGQANLAYYAPQPLGLPVDARALFEVTFRVDRLVDLTTPEAMAVLVAAGLSEAELFADDYGRCPDVAQYGEAHGWEAVRAPSAALEDGVCFAVMPGHHPAHGLWRILLPAARPTVATAYLTRYRDGERPAWLNGAAPAAAAA